MERGRITTSGKELAQYIEDLYNSGAKLWTKQMFYDIEAELMKEPKPHTIMIRSMNGECRRKRVPQFANMKHLVLTPHFKIYQRIVSDAGQETFELDELEPAEHNIDNDRALATRALTIVGSEKSTSTIEYTQIKSAWNEARKNWLESTVCRELTVTLAKAAYIPKTITKVVCFGLGSLEGSSDRSFLHTLASCDGLPRRSAMTQHAAALTIAALLGQRLGIPPLSIMAQDPAYSMAAIHVLEDEGMVVVGGRGSLAFTHVDENTFVFSCNPNIPVKQVVADIAKPAAMIWNRVKPAADESKQWVHKVAQGKEVVVSPWSTDEDSLRTRTLINDYVELDFPAERERFGDLKIYIRQE